MISFEKIKFRNFLAYGNNWTEFVFEEGVTRIAGDTGQGKSTVLEALYFALFGKTYRDVNLPQLVNCINRKDLEVHLWFTINGKNYRIERGIKPNKFFIFCNDVPVEVPAETKSYQEYLETDILQFNAGIFDQTSYKSLTKNSAFLTLKKADKREIVDNIFDTKIYMAMNKAAKDKVDALTKELSDLYKDITHNDNLIQQEEANIVNLERIKEEQSAKSSAKIVQLKEQIAELEADSVKKQTAIDKIQKYKTRKTELLAEKKVKQDALNELTNEMNEAVIKANRKHNDDVERANDERDSLIGTYITHRNQEKKTYTDVKESLIKKLTQEKTLVVSDLNEDKNLKFTTKTSELADVSNKISVLKNKVKFLQETCGDCPNISKLVEDEDISGLLATKKRLEGELEEDRVFYRTKIDDTVEDFDSQIKEAKDALYEYVLAFGKESDEKVSEIKTKTTETIQRLRVEADVDVINIRASYKEKIEAAQVVVDSCAPDIEKCNEYINMEAGFQSQINHNNTQIKQYQVQIKSEESQEIVIDLTKLESYKTQKEALRVTYESKEDDKKHYVFARSLLSDEAIKAFVIKKYLPSINTLLNSNLQRFGSDIIFEFDEEFEMVVKSRHKEGFTYFSFSEGQKRRIDLAILFMMVEFCAIKYQNAITNIMVLDEVGTGLDVKLQQIFYSILKEKATQDKKNIIIMNHGEISPEYIDKQFVVVNEKGFANIVEEKL